MKIVQINEISRTTTTNIYVPRIIIIIIVLTTHNVYFPSHLRLDVRCCPVYLDTVTKTVATEYRRVKVMFPSCKFTQYTLRIFVFHKKCIYPLGKFNVLFASRVGEYTQGLGVLNEHVWSEKITFVYPLVFYFNNFFFIFSL